MMGLQHIDMKDYKYKFKNDRIYYCDSQECYWEYGKICINTKTQLLVIVKHSLLEFHKHDEMTDDECDGIIEFAEDANNW